MRCNYRRTGPAGRCGPVWTGAGRWSRLKQRRRGKVSQMGAVLPDWRIQEEIERGVIQIDPYDPARIQPASIDVHLGLSTLWPRDGILGRIVDSREDPSRYFTR